MISIHASLENPADPRVSLTCSQPWGELRAALIGNPLAGAKYDSSERSYTVAHESWALVHEALVSAGIHVTQDESIQDWLLHEKAVVQELEAKAALRIANLEIQLASRNLKLREYQRVGINWLSSRRGGLLCDDPGLGKTLQVICAIPDATGVIIVCPATLREYWKQEINIWRPELQIQILEGRNAFKYPRVGQAVIMSDATLPDNPVAWRNIYLAVDECHVFKSRDAIRTKRLSKLCGLIRANNGWTIGMTATPLLNTPEETYTLTQVFGVDRLAWGSLPEFRDLWGAVPRPAEFGGGYYWRPVPGPEARERLARVSLRRLQSDVLPDLPSLSYREVPVTLPKKLVKELDALERDMSRELQDWEYHDVMPEFSQWSECKSELSALKLEACRGMLDEYERADTKVLVFSDHLYVIDYLGTRKRWAKITGAVPSDQRKSIADSFQGAREVVGLAMTIKTGGVGLNLQAASHVIFVDRNVTPALNYQAICRAWRSGVKHPVFVTDLISSHPLEKRIFKILMAKQKLAESL